MAGKFSTDDLVKSCMAGDEAAWAELIRRFTPLVHTLLRARGLQPADADDACQEVWRRVWNTLTSEKYQPSGKFEAWLCAFAINESKTSHRKNRGYRRSKPVDGTLCGDLFEDGSEVVEEMQVGADMSAMVEEALGRLDREARFVVERVNRDGMTLAECAKALRKSLSEVFTLYWGGIQQVRKVLTEMKFDASPLQRKTMLKDQFDELCAAINSLDNTRLPRVSVGGLVKAISALRRASELVGSHPPGIRKCLAIRKLRNKSPVELIELAGRYRAWLLDRAGRQRDRVSSHLDQRVDLDELLRTGDMAEALIALVRKLRPLGSREATLTAECHGKPPAEQKALLAEKTVELAAMIDLVREVRLPLASRKRLERGARALLKAADRIGLRPAGVDRNLSLNGLEKLRYSDLTDVAVTCKERILACAKRQWLEANRVIDATFTIDDLLLTEEISTVLKTLYDSLDPLDHRDVPQKLAGMVDRAAKLAASCPTRETHEAIEESIALLKRHRSDGMTRSVLSRQVDKLSAFCSRYERDPR